MKSSKTIPIGLISILCFFISSDLIAKTKPNQRRKPANYDVTLAQGTFSQFLQCKSVRVESERLNCMSKQLTSNLGIDEARRFVVMFDTQLPISPAQLCNSDTIELVEGLESEKYELYLCFSSEFYGKEKTGIVFFQKESDSVKISKIKW